MPHFQKISLFLLRVGLGILYGYAGWSKLVNPTWSAAGYLKGAKTATWLYHFFLLPDILPVINFLNEWGLFLLGVSLILGIGIRISGWAGIFVMAMYYVAILSFPYVGEHSWIVDEHVIYACALLVLISMNAGHVWGIAGWVERSVLGKKYPWLKKVVA